MADVGLPGNMPADDTKNVKVGVIKMFCFKVNPINATQNSAILKFKSTYNYLYRCSAASSGIRLNQTLWFN